MAITPDLIRPAARAGVSDDTMNRLVEVYVAQQRRRLQRRCPLADITDGFVNGAMTLFEWCMWPLRRLRRHPNDHPSRPAATKPLTWHGYKLWTGSVCGFCRSSALQCSWALRAGPSPSRSRSPRGRPGAEDKTASGLSAQRNTRLTLQLLDDLAG